jgi:hypothetical protein
MKQKSFLVATLFACFIFVPLQLAAAFSISKTYSGGNTNFGYRNILTASDSYSKNGSKYTYILNANNKTYVTALSSEQEVAEIIGKAWSYGDLSIYNQVSVEFLNYTIYTYYKCLSAKLVLPTTSFSKSYSQSGNFVLGLIPVTVKASVMVALAANGTCEANTTGVNFSLKPQGEAAATVQAGVGATCKYAGASAGAQGKLSIIKSQLLANTALNILTKKITAKIDWVNTLLNGYLGIYAEVYISKLKYTWSKVLAEFTAAQKTTNLYQGTASI